MGDNNLIKLFKLKYIPLQNYLLVLLMNNQQANYDYVNTIF